MKKYSLFVGIDVSKAKLDVTLLNESAELEAQHFIVVNNDKGFDQILRAISKQKAPQNSLLFCFEDTGNYSVPLFAIINRNTPYVNLQKFAA